MSFEILLKTAPAKAIPRVNKNPYKMLKLLANGEPIVIREADKFLNAPCRDAVSRLRKDGRLNWSIHTLQNEQGKDVYYQLDPRHLSGCKEQDAKARLHSKIKHKTRSVKQARSEKERLPKAKRELTELTKKKKRL